MTDSRQEVEKIDLVTERTGLEFHEARELLEDANWDLLEALVIHEQEKKALTGEWEERGQELVSKAKSLIRQGNIRKVRVLANGKTLAEFPVTVGIVGALFAPKLALFAAATCMFSKCTVEFERTDDTLDTYEYNAKEEELVKH